MHKMGNLSLAYDNPSRATSSMLAARSIAAAAVAAVAGDGWIGVEVATLLAFSSSSSLPSP